jgi:FMN phosphatase YigB (HAD superfamily)/CTP:phosphocholine cytidylyltransferase-like protein
MKPLIIFDLDDCLVDTYGAIVPTLIKQAVTSMIEGGLSMPSKQAISRLTEINDQAKNGTEALQKFLLEQGRPELLHSAREAFYNFGFDYEIKPLPGVLKMLENTQADFALVTKGEFRAQMDKLRRAGISYTLFKKILVVDDYDKKEPYLRVMKELGYSPENCFVCGDRYETDLIPAKDLGLKTIHVPWGRGKVTSAGDVDFTIKDFKEIIDVVNKNSGPNFDGLITLSQGNLHLGVYKGKIVSFSKNGYEYMHGASKPEQMKTPEDRKGWDKSEIIMFPIIGPVKDFGLKLENQTIPLDQHGLTRNFGFEVVEKKEDYLKMRQDYTANTPIPNAKFSSDSERPPYLTWPFSYTLEEEIKVEKDQVTITFTVINNSNLVMPYMLGWHPAFKVDSSGKFEVEGKYFTLSDVISASQNMALFLPNANSITYTSRKHNGITVTSTGYGKAMLWCPNEDAGMCCIEPVTHLPIRGEDSLSSSEMETLKPAERKQYSVNLKPLETNYKVCILAAGIGSRMENFTKTFNKSLIPVHGKPAICHIIEKFPEDVPIVIALGYKKDTVVDYLVHSYPKRTLEFVHVDKYEGPGTGPGYSLLQCKPNLQCPFIFFSADTLVRDEIPAPDQNWFGLAEVNDTSRFCSAKEENGIVVRIDDKVKCDNRHAFIGLAGVYDYEFFWQNLESNTTIIGGEIQVSNGFSALMQKTMHAKVFNWFDVGTPSAYEYTLGNYPYGCGYSG